MVINYKNLIIIIFLLLSSSCRKVDEYFRSPDTEVLANTIIANIITAYSANAALSCISGNDLPHVVTTRSNAGFPCTSLMIMTIDQAPDLPFPISFANTITIAALWADENTGILTILITDYNSSTSTFSLLGIETIPVIRHEGNVMVAVGDQDINFSPDQESILEFDLDEMEIETELDRLEAMVPEDVYIAVEQRAYAIDIDCKATPYDLSDDSYTISGGGQLVEVTTTSAEVIQLAMVEVTISPVCQQNPITGMSLLRIVGTETEHFPELGTVIFQFHDMCDGQAEVMVATGMFLLVNGTSVAFNL